MKKAFALLVVFSLMLSLSACTFNINVKENKPTKATTKTQTTTPTKKPATAPTKAPTTAPTKTPAGETATTATVPCLSIILDADMMILDKADTPVPISYLLQPDNTTDKVTFTSADPKIATVDETGIITPVAEGETEIRIYCGSVLKTCKVYCQFAEDPTAPTTPDATDTTGATDVTGPTEAKVTLNRMDITFTYKGESWDMYSGTVAKNLVTFSSDDETVATFVDGRVVAVGSGMTTVYAAYGDKKVSCIVRCSFQEDSGTQGSGGVSEDGGGSGTGAIPVDFTGKIINVLTTLNVRSGPGTEYAKVGELLLNEQVTITAVSSDSTGMQWYHTQAGWVRADYVQLN